MLFGICIEVVKGITCVMGIVMEVSSREVSVLCGFVTRLKKLAKREGESCQSVEAY